MGLDSSMFMGTPPAVPRFSLYSAPCNSRVGPESDSQGAPACIQCVFMWKSKNTQETEVFGEAWGRGQEKSHKLDPGQ